MQLLDLSLDEPVPNLALDEALLEQSEAAGAPREVLRLWEPARPLVVVGRGSRLADEVDLPRCEQLGIPVLRRASGGAAIVTGPGCLMYAVVLSYDRRPELRTIDAAHRFVLARLVEALAPLAPGVARQGTSDLALGDCKFSGNSLRCKREHLLYHGTLLYDFPLELIAQCLRRPPREPAYRAGRTHAAFVRNLPLAASQIRAALAAAWQAREPCADWPRAATQALSAGKYSLRSWIDGAPR